MANVSLFQRVTEAFWSVVAGLHSGAPRTWGFLLLLAAATLVAFAAMLLPRVILRSRESSTHQPARGGGLALVAGLLLILFGFFASYLAVGWRRDVPVTSHLAGRHNGDSPRVVEWDQLTESSGPEVAAPQIAVPEVTPPQIAGPQVAGPQIQTPVAPRIEVRVKEPSAAVAPEAAAKAIASGATSPERAPANTEHPGADHPTASNPSAPNPSVPNPSDARASKLDESQPGEPLPEWTKEQAGRATGGPLVVVKGGMAATAESAQSEALQRAVDVVAADLARTNPEVGQWRPPAQAVRSAAVRQTYTAEIHRKTLSSSTPFHVYQSYCQVEISSNVHDRLLPLWKSQLVERRLLALGGLAGLLTLTFGTVAAYFRLDDSTSGQFRWRLKLAAASIIAAGGLAAATLL